MLVIGLTGGIGSGKTTVASMFAEHGIDIIDSDLIAREVVNPGSVALKQISDHFGKDILDSHGALNRLHLRKIIMHDNLARKWLETLLHPLIMTILKQRISQAQLPYCIAVIPLLIESKQISFVDRILVIDTTEQLQTARIRNRDAHDEFEAQLMQSLQATRKQRLAMADDIINNTDDFNKLREQVMKLHAFYLSLS